MVPQKVGQQAVPAEVIHRPKMGFAMPLQRWFQQELGLALERLLIDSVAKREAWLNSARVLRELEDHRDGRRDNHTRLWLILWLELWFRVVVAGEMDHDADLSELLEACVS